MRTVRKGVTVATVLVAVAVVGVVAVLIVNRDQGPQSPYCTVSAAGAGGDQSGAGSTATGSGDYSFTAEQAGNAATIAAVASKLGLPPHAVTVALATAWQESKLINLTSGDRDSAGLFQQRPSQGWGTYAQVTDPVYASTVFYQHLSQQQGWQSMSVTQAAQQVQHSASPDAYAQWESVSRAMASALTGEAPAALACHNLTIAPAKTSLVASAEQEWGTASLSGTHDLARGWAIGSWLVANATQFGIDSVTVGDRTWTSASGVWSAPTANTSTTGPVTVSLHQVSAAPTSQAGSS